MTANRKRARYFPDIEEILASIPQSPELSSQLVSHTARRTLFPPSALPHTGCNGPAVWVFRRIGRTWHLLHSGCCRPYRRLHQGLAAYFHSYRHGHRDVARGARLDGGRDGYRRGLRHGRQIICRKSSLQWFRSFIEGLSESGHANFTCEASATRCQPPTSLRPRPQKRPSTSCLRP
jgi:hypothetical protein